MGLFKKGKSIKAGRVYSLAEALQRLSQPGCEDLTTKEVPGGYEIIKVEESKIEERQLREKQEFYNRMNGNGAYRNNTIVPQQYDNWQTKANIEYTR